MESFAKRAIDLTITLGRGQYGEDPGDPILLSGHRVLMSTQVYTTQSQGRMDCLVYGLPLALMNQLTCIGIVGQNVVKNSVRVSAGDVSGKLSLVYQGLIYTAYADFSGTPEVPLVISAKSSLLDAVKPAPPTSYVGSVDAAVVLESLAKQMNLSFKNDGVSVQLSNPYFHGTLLNQFRSCAQAASISYEIDGPSVTIWPKGATRKNEPVLISPETGLVGYPAFSSQGLLLTVLFNPNLRTGGKVTVVSSVTPACGDWLIFRVSHSLASEMPNGPWFTQIECQQVQSNG